MESGKYACPHWLLFASALDQRTKYLRAYSKEDRKKIWAGLHQKVMEHYQLLEGVVEREHQQQEADNNTNKEDQGAAELQPPYPKTSHLQDFLI
jgi:hypothetical protein